jgi:hypothetical protein
MFKSKALLAVLVGTVASSACMLTMASAGQAEIVLPTIIGAGGSYTGTVGAFTLETADNSHVVCAASGSTSEGALTGDKTMTAVLHLRGCRVSGYAITCNTEGAAKGEIVTQPLQGRLFYVHRGEPQPVAGFVFKPVTGENIATNFTCWNSAPGNFRGAVIGVIAAADRGRRTTEITLQFKQAKGHQEPAEYEDESGHMVLTSLESSWPSYVNKPFQSLGLAFESTMHTREVDVEF